MARRLTETWNCVTGAIQPDVREGGQDGPPGAARWRDGQPARDGFEHVYYVRRYYDKTMLSWYLLNIVKAPPGPGIPRAAHDSAMVPAAARPLPLVPCKSWSHEHAALWNGS